MPMCYSALKRAEIHLLKSSLKTHRRTTVLHRASASNDVLVEVGIDGSVMYRFGGPLAPAVKESSVNVTPHPIEAVDHRESAEKSSDQKQFRSSWDAKDARGGGSSPEADYLYELGRSDLNLNIDTGQNSINLDSVFIGDFLGHKSDIADGSLRGYEFRSFNNVVGDYYVAPRFLDAVVMHIAKNFLLDQGSFDESTRVPLILGIWGGKGQGKSFQTELAFRKLGVEAIVMSAGELESDRAGEPGRLIRDRYRRAAELSRVRGRLSCLLINDLDAGIGHFENTQLTVNNQMVVGSLMSICDDPKRVTLFGVEWNENEKLLPRIPIIVTGNDLSTVFAPLVRDGRMEKFFWQPSKDDLVNILHQMYKDDGLSSDDMMALLSAFPNQSLDFFGAIRASTYDGQIREWIKRDVIKGDISDENENMKELGRRLVLQDDLPRFEPVQLTQAMLMKEGRRLVEEQDHVNSMKLSEEYMKKQRKIQKGMIGLSG